MARSFQAVFRISVALGLAVSTVVVLTGSEAFAGAVLTVNSSADAPDVDPGDGVCDTGAITSALDRECTLRAAIQEANEPGPNRQIAFSIPAGMDPIIQPGSPLPPLTRRMDIDGTTQPGFAGTPAIFIDGSETITGAGLELRVDDSIVRGLAIGGFADAGIAVHGDRNTISGNYVGMERNGVTAAGNADGVVVSGKRNVIGGPSPSDRNVISGNREAGVAIDGAERTHVAGNHIGLDAAGVSAVPNFGGGIEVLGSADRTRIGPDNTISGNMGHGIEIDAGTTLGEIVGNTVGASADGSKPVGNELTGVTVSADGVIVELNQISSNGSGGVRVEIFAET
jgi:CSLREA domain-containing protein